MGGREVTKVSWSSSSSSTTRSIGSNSVRGRHERVSCGKGFIIPVTSVWPITPFWSLVPSEIADEAITKMARIAEKTNGRDDSISQATSWVADCRGSGIDFCGSLSTANSGVPVYFQFWVEFSSHRVEKMEKLELVGLQIFNNFFCERLLVKSGNLRSTINIVLVKTKRCRRKIWFCGIIVVLTVEST